MSRFSPAIETDPMIDISGLLKHECFLCSHPILFANDLGRWGQDGGLDVLLDCHISCLNGRSPAEVALEYHRRIHDLAGVARTH